MKRHLLILLVAGFGTLAALAQFSIDWFKVAGSSGTSAGGTFAIVGVIGQPDAGHLSGGPFAVTGGVLALPVPVQTPGTPTLLIIPGDTPGTALISWTPSTTGFVLQETPTLSPATWVNSPSGPTNQITVRAAAPVKFYRLFNP